MSVRLSQLFAAFPSANMGKNASEIVQTLCLNSRIATDRDVFIAHRGESIDSHKFLPEVCGRGVLAVVVESVENIPKNFAGGILKVSSAQTATAMLAREFYKNPSGQLISLGVTGTNGKTSVTYMLEKIFSDVGWPCGVIGTINHHLQEKVWPTDLTTPDAVSLQGRLREFVDFHAKCLAFEVSSHALAQHRVDGIDFDVGIFTNLTRDHLDYHQTMENYFAAKERLFSELLAQSGKANPAAIINTDDEWGRKIKVPAKVRKIDYGQNSQQFTFTLRSEDFSGSHFQLKSPEGTYDGFVPVIGLHNVYNSVAALAAGFAVGVPVAQGLKALKSYVGVLGRLERVPNSKGLNVFVDYAHTSDALEKVLTALAQVRANSRVQSKITTVFGCGGDRDKGKRPMMLQTALRFSDRVVLTSDNPRTEDPQQIINDCLANLTGVQDRQQLKTEVKRKDAIHIALSDAQENDVILIAGKGHEDYQIIGREKLPFSDVQVVKEFLR